MITTRYILEVSFFSIIEFLGVDAKCSGGFYYPVDIRSIPHGRPRHLRL